MTESEQEYRLPRTVVPSRYDLTLEPDLDAGTFDGTVEVRLEVREPVTEIVLNANELWLDEAALVADRSRVRRRRP
jgi:aminopeptidase N